MTINFNELARRSTVPGAVSQINTYRPTAQRALRTYDGQTLTVFLRRYGADPMRYRQMLLHNQIGDPFVELQPGIRLELEVRRG